MWTDLRQEIEKIRKELRLSHKVRPVGLNQWKEIEAKLYDTFSITRTHTSRPLWIWGNLKVKHSGIRVDDNPYLHLSKLIDPDTNVFLFLNDRWKGKLWIYEGQTHDIQRIIQESAELDEVIIVDKKFNWILCINHHDNIIIGGEDKMIERLNELKNRLSTT